MRSMDSRFRGNDKPGDLTGLRIVFRAESQGRWVWEAVDILFSLGQGARKDAEIAKVRAGYCSASLRDLGVPGEIRFGGGRRPWQVLKAPKARARPGGADQNPATF